MSIEKAYEAIKNRIPKRILIDSLSVVKQVDEYRQFWKPIKTNVILLAESHVFTSDDNFKVLCRNQWLSQLNYPSRYVRFVYCLGYGENNILNTNVDNNKGTPQYWKIFSSSVAKNEYDLGFEKVNKLKTPLLNIRLRNKVGLLQEMKRRGIWLLDASIVGIYGSIAAKHNELTANEIFELKKSIFTICWDNYLINTVMEAKPKSIIVIGKGAKSVEGILKWRLNQLEDKLGTSYSALPQPQGSRGSSEEQLNTYKEYQRICSKYC